MHFYNAILYLVHKTIRCGALYITHFLNVYILNAMFNLVDYTGSSVGSTINVKSLIDIYVAECLNGFATLQRQFKVSYKSLFVF